MTYLVTGATGLLGSQLVEVLVSEGQPVRALVRASSDRERLQQLGVEQTLADLREPGSLDEPLTGIHTVYHCAAHLGDWGSWSEFYQGNVVTTRHLVDACLRRGIQRLVFVSSVAAYGHPTGQGQLDEQAALGQRLWLWDHYARSKMLAEREAQRLGERTTVVRPTWIYGPGDRNILPRLIENLRKGRVQLLGSGDNLLNMVYVGDVADGMLRAAAHEQAGGQVYNLTSSGEITQRELWELLCGFCGLPPVTGRVPIPIAHYFGFCCEAAGKLTARRNRPHVTRHGISLLSRPTRFSSGKARQQLGWQPRVAIREGLQRTLQWLESR